MVEDKIQPIVYGLAIILMNQYTSGEIEITKDLLDAIKDDGTGLYFKYNYKKDTYAVRTTDFNKKAVDKW